MFGMLKALTALLLPALLAGSILNTPTVDSSQFRVTTFANGLPFVTGVVRAKDNSILALVSPGYGAMEVRRFLDANSDGVADGTGTVLYSNAVGGLGTQIRQTDNLIYVGRVGDGAITALRPGASAGDPLSFAGELNFQFASGHWHPMMGMAFRPTPGIPGSVDMVFNVGSQYNNQTSVDPVRISGLGLAPTDLQGDSLWMLSINETGPAPVASNLRRVASGIRNVYGMTFHPVTGDLYFADNGIDEASPSQNSQPVQADELNRIAAADLGVTVPFFGYPNCYPAYGTNVLVETVPGSSCGGVTQSLINFQPVNGQRSEGPTEIAFAPSAFPAAYAGGLFAGFAGGSGPGGVNNQNALVFANASFSQLLHFIESGTPGVERVLGVYSTQDSLFMSNFANGQIYQIAAVSSVAEPGSLIFAVLGLGCFGVIPRRRQA